MCSSAPEVMFLRVADLMELLTFCAVSVKISNSVEPLSCSVDVL